MRVVILSFGSRGDIQPCAALGKGLKAAGHTVTLAVPPEFESFATENGLTFAPIRVDIRAVMDSESARSMVKGGNNLLNFIKPIIDIDLSMFKHVLADSLAAARGADLLIAHAITPGYDIAAALDIPMIGHSPLPFSPTGAFPSVLMPPVQLGRVLNRSTHGLFASMLWLINRAMWNSGRKQAVGLPPLPMSSPAGRMHRDRAPILYAYSPRIVPRPDDWGEHLPITGYWFLDQAEGYTPPAELQDFLDSGAPPVFIGFGSMTGRDPQTATRQILDALHMAGQRGVLVSGWGGIGEQVSGRDDVYVIDSVPHDWLFPRMAAIIHHGGAGTTGAGLRAGKPGMAIPHFGDQLFWGDRIHRLGVGPAPLTRRKLTAETLSGAITQLVSDAGMQRRAAEIGALIRAEDGVGRAVAEIEKRAATL